MDHQTAGRSFHQPIIPPYYIEDCRIFKFKSWMGSNAHKSQDADVRSSDMKRFLSMCTWPTNAMAQKWNIFIESIYRRKMHPNHLRSHIWMNYFFWPRIWSKKNYWILWIDILGPSMSFYPDFISILSWFYPNFIQIKSG